MHLAYRCAYVVLFFVYIPKLLFEIFVGRKSLSWFWQRFWPRPLEKAHDNLAPLVWIHSVSVGEVLIAEAFIQQLLQKSSYRFVVSCVTPTGFKTAQKHLAHCASIRFLPFDFAFSVRRLFIKEAPCLVVLSEGDVWPEFLFQAKGCGAKIAVINGKLSERSYKRLSRFSFFGTWLYSFLDACYVQSEQYAVRFFRFVPAQTSLVVTGNMKGDVHKSTLLEVEHVRRYLNAGDDKILVLGSTHAPEELQLLQVLVPLLHQRAFRIIVVPRHPHRFTHVFELLQKIAPVGMARYSCLSECPSWKVLVLDQMGLLERMYAVSDIACVCGSFVEDIGGHNIIEAAQWGVPCIVGPYMHSQQSIVETAKNVEAIVQVASYSDVPMLVQKLLDDESFWSMQSEAAFRLAAHVQGAAQRTVEQIFPMIQRSN